MVNGPIGMSELYRLMREKTKLILISLLLASLTLFLYWTVQSFEFVNIDDHTFVTKNPYVQKGLSPEGIEWAIGSLYSGSWHPLTWLSHMLDWDLYRSNAGGHHWTNVLIHLAAVLVLFWVLTSMTGMLWASALVAALFSIHPLHVESVAWVSERRDVLSGLFWFVTMGVYTYYVRSPGWGRYLMVLLSFASGLMAKPMLVTLPFVLLLLDGWPLARVGNAVTTFDRFVKGPIWFRLCVEKVPLIVLSVAVGIVTCLAQKGVGAIRTLEQYPLGVRVANAVVSYGEYIRKMVCPVDLAVFYPYPGLPPAWSIIMAVLSLTAVSVWVIRHARRYPYLAVGWLWYLGTLVPVIGIIQVGSQSMADRYTYLPLVGLFVAAAAGASALAERLPAWRPGIIIITLIVLFTYGMLAKAQIETWKNSFMLSEHAIQVTKVNPVAHNNVGALYLSAGPENCEKAVPHFLKAIEQKSDYAAPHYNLGICVMHAGGYERAIHLFQTAAQLDPGSSRVRTDLGLLLIRQGKFDAATKEFLHVLSMEPNHEAAHTNLAMILIYQGKLRNAEGHLREALRVQPHSVQALNNFGLLRMGQGRVEEAIASFRQAHELAPGDTVIESNLKVAYDKQKNEIMEKGSI